MPRPRRVTQLSPSKFLSISTANHLRHLGLSPLADVNVWVKSSFSQLLGTWRARNRCAAEARLRSTRGLVACSTPARRTAMSNATLCVSAIHSEPGNQVTPMARHPPIPGIPLRFGKQTLISPSGFLPLDYCVDAVLPPGDHGGPEPAD